MKVYLPHINFTVEFCDMTNLQGMQVKGAAYTAATETGAIVFVENFEKNRHNIDFTPWLAHEIVHVLQIICERINANFVNEQEHMAYIMHYLLQELTQKQSTGAI